MCIMRLAYCQQSSQDTAESLERVVLTLVNLCFYHLSAVTSQRAGQHTSSISSSKAVALYMPHTAS